MRKEARAPLYIAFTAFGLAAGLGGREVIDTGTSAQPTREPRQGYEEPFQPTIGVNVIVQFPTETPVPTATPFPTPSGTSTPSMDYCSTPKPGEACKVPPPTPEPPTPYPDCTAMTPDVHKNDICIWPTPKV